MQPIIQHVQEHLALYVGGVVLVLPLLYLFRKQTAPVLYHTAEYLIYCTVFHFVVGGLFRVGSWFRLETSFRNHDGSIAADYVAFTNPLNFNFWQKELYNPEWLFYFEIAAAAGFLYLVIVVRPMRFKRNVYKGRVEKPLDEKKQERQRKTMRASSQRRTDAQRARLQKLRDSR